MTKIMKKEVCCTHTPKKNKQKSAPLDKYAQLFQNGVQDSNSKESRKGGSCSDIEGKTTVPKSKSHLSYAARQQRKAITSVMAVKLANTKRSLRYKNDKRTKGYWRGYHCNSVLRQTGSKMRSQYCNTRFCLVCSRIRMAKMIDGYTKPLMALEDLYFVTLTCLNYRKASVGIKEMAKRMNWVMKQLRKKYKKLQGIRKLECTISKDFSFNLHYHLVINGKDVANDMKALWLKANPTAYEGAQKIKKADMGTMKELFKYAAKPIHEGAFHATQLDELFRALHGKRIIQPFGIKKDVTEDVSGIESQIIDFKEEQNTSWIWDYDIHNWLANEGECLVDNKIEGKFQDQIDAMEALYAPEAMEELYAPK